MIYIKAREAAFLRKASPSRSLPESGWRSGWDISSILVPPERWERFPVTWLSPRRLTEPPRTCGGGEYPQSAFG